jgi:hypothetical protein
MHDDCVCALALAAEHYKRQFGQSLGGYGPSIDDDGTSSAFEDIVV